MKTDIESALELEKRIHLFINIHIIPYITKKGYSDQAWINFWQLLGDGGLWIHVCAGHIKKSIRKKDLVAEANRVCQRGLLRMGD